ncbi:MAG: hypothetical protein ABGX44_00345 [Candidatus Poseidoniia archaeon]|nr:MAG: hypothetical protein CXT68_02325 [Euryarchaeota archaeon]
METVAALVTTQELAQKLIQIENKKRKKMESDVALTALGKVTIHVLALVFIQTVPPSESPVQMVEGYAANAIKSDIITEHAQGYFQNERPSKGIALKMVSVDVRLAIELGIIPARVQR